MEPKRQILDRISGLPQDMIEKILTLMPMRDALRTSILSKKWRYSWTRMPKLVFDGKMVNSVSSNSPELYNSKLVIAMFHVLLLHRVPISELCIRIGKTEIDNHNAIDQIILHLSWNKDINKFLLENLSMYKYYYKLPCSFFSLKGLEHLSLKYCEFELPLMFNGFSMLKSLVLYKVKITADMLQRFLTSCPLLEEFTLTGDRKFKNVTGGNECTFVELFKCLPLVQVVTISWTYNEHFAAGGMSQKLPTSLVYLWILVLEVRFFKQDQLSSTVHVINSSPNLEKIQMTMVRDVGQTVTTLLDPQYHLDLISLNHLKELKIIRFHNYAPEMEFVKLIMANSPLLKKARIELSKFVSLDEENKMLRDFLLHPFPRASPSANFIIERPK